MKKINFLLLIFCFFTDSYAQLKDIKTKIDEVTVFTKGAQVTRKKKIDLQKGITELKFSNLSQFINPESIRIKATGVTILSVSHTINFNSENTEKTEKQNEILENELQKEQALLTVIRDNIDFLNKNKELSGKNNPISAGNLQQVLDFYSQRMSDLRIKEKQKVNLVNELHKKIQEFKRNQKKEIESIKKTSDILVKVRSEVTGNFPFEISYVVNNASWKATYDIRATDISKPISLTYKAIIQQDSQEDWNNVKLVLSTANPETGNEAPELRTYFLDYNKLPPRYEKTPNIRGKISGLVTDSQGVPLIGASIIISGTSTETFTNSEGKFQLNASDVKNKSLKISFVGYQTQYIEPKSILTIRMEEKSVEVDEVVVSGFASPQKKENTFIRGSNTTADEVEVSRKNIDFHANYTPTNLQFEIQDLYSIKSDNQEYTVEMQKINLPTTFEHYSVPKIEEKVYLLGYITNFQKYNLLKGEASIFFENTFVGYSDINPELSPNTLKISLGIDKGITIKRENIKDFTQNQFIGSKKEISKTWKTTVINHKNTPVNLVIFDQVPLSNNKEIEVFIKNTSGGKIDEQTNEVKWNFNLQPSKKQELELEYSVKYPKQKLLYIE